ncbi:hypothetical protein [Pseudomarimonas salicorniae]|uniref:GTPase n=1 Tax=Pseudomarimonas salicorniae TaxID=2933270 RepID=A0ABT0GGK3_9GAMM|nr:hypothetical protein [Lysobacter sp. CAU 1642]MCK7593145.1 hypothetical protein [Lysobacter sp. CAU 1642]
MSQPYSDLLDGLAPRSAPGADSFPADPRRASAWVNALPRANQAVTGDMLEKALVNLRGQRLDGGQRLAVMEILRPMLLEVMQTLLKQCQSSPIPLPPPKARLFDRLQLIEHETALGYRLALVEYCAPAGKVPLLRGGNVALALERALFHTARCLAHAYFVYRQPPPGIWLQLHRLYAFAQSVRLQDKAVDDAGAKQALSPRSIYAHALLIAVSNPYRFSQREQGELAELGPQLAGHVSITEKREQEDDLAVPLDSDRGPGYIASEREDDDTARLWISVATLREQIDAALAGAQGDQVEIRGSDGKPRSMPAELLSRLRGGWGRSQSRRNTRLAAQHQLDTAIGLSGLHFHLAGLVDFDTFLRQAGDSEESAPDSKAPQRAVWAHAAVDAGRIPLQSAVVADQSLGGYHLHWEAEEGVKARVGELIGLSVPEEGEERQWLLGVIRWLRYDADGCVDAGVQLLSRRVRPVALRLLDGEGRLPLRGIEYQPVHGEANGALHFSAAGTIEAGAQQIEVLRVPDMSDLDEPVSMREMAESPTVAENAGDYVLLTAQRSGGAA